VSSSFFPRWDQHSRNKELFTRTLSDLHPFMREHSV